jgi:hypothetical protein
MPIILAMWEADIRRIMVPGQHQQKQFVRPWLNNNNNKAGHGGCHLSCCRKCKIERLQSRPVWAKSETLSSK